MFSVLLSEEVAEKESVSSDSSCGRLLRGLLWRAYSFGGIDGRGEEQSLYLWGGCWWDKMDYLIVYLLFFVCHLDLGGPGVSKYLGMPGWLYGQLSLPFLRLCSFSFALSMLAFCALYFLFSFWAGV